MGMSGTGVGSAGASVAGASVAGAPVAGASGSGASVAGVQAAKARLATMTSDSRTNSLCFTGFSSYREFRIEYQGTLMVGWNSLLVSHLLSRSTRGNQN